MKFTGYGIIWNPKKNKALVDFKVTPVFESNDPYELSILSKCDHIESSGAIDISDKELTKRDVMEALNDAGIKYNPRDKKEVLLSLLEG